jgi:hypothetical protein
MTFDEYRRVHAACLDMARQSGLPDVWDRWPAMATVWLERAADYKTHDYPLWSERSQRVHVA